MTIKELKDKIYEEYKKEIDMISENSKREDWQADIGVATDMFISFVDNTEVSIFVDVAKAKAKLAELRAQIEE